MHVSLTQRSAERSIYSYETKKYAADDLVLLDEAIFNEKTRWRSLDTAGVDRRVNTFNTSPMPLDTYAVLAATTSFNGAYA